MTLKNFYSSPAFVSWCLFILSVFVLAGCNQKKEQNTEKKEAVKNKKSNVTNPENKGRPQKAEFAKVLGTVPEFEFVDQDGNSFGTKQLKGQVWIVNFIFTTCKSTCPEQTRVLKGMTNQLKLQEKNNPGLDGMNFISITVDPNTDTPEQLKKYATSYQADTKYWKFLTGSREEIWNLCKTGFKLPVAEDADNTDSPIAHDPRFVLVDRQLRIRGYFDLSTREGRDGLSMAFSHVLPEFTPPKYFADQFPAEESITHIAAPPEIATTHWLKNRQSEQLATQKDIKSFVGFQFEDKLADSGITYNPQIVDEQRWRMQVNHYDHGNGISICDVDNDGKLDIYFTSQASRNELWRNLGNGKFEDITESSGVGVENRISVTASFGDIDNDGDSDLFVTTVRGGNLLFQNDGKGHFKDITEASGLKYEGHSSGAIFFDYDRDGQLDLFVTNVGKYTTENHELVRHDRTSSLPAGKEIRYYTGALDTFAGHLKKELNESSILYHNDGGKFKDVTKEMGIVDIGWSGDATPIDGNSDGWPDLYVLNMQGHDQYYENQQGKGFKRKSREVFRATPWGAMGVKAFDFDNDLNIDLYLTDMHSDMADNIAMSEEKKKMTKTFPDSMLFGNNAIAEKQNSIFGNAFYKGDGKGGFAEISDKIGAENYWPWGLSVADLNADGFQDAFVASSMCFPYRYAVNSILINEQGTRFADAEFILGVEPRPDGRLIRPWFELDADGVDKNNVICANRSGKVIVWSALGTRSSAIFDLDDDGDLDIVTSEFNSEPMVLISNLSQQKKINFLKIELEGTQSNRDALGTKVIVTAGDKKYLQVNDGVSGYLSHSVAPLYFGLADAAEVSQIDITWPNGKTETRKGPIAANQTLKIKEAN